MARARRNAKEKAASAWRTHLMSNALALFAGDRRSGDATAAAGDGSDSRRTARSLVAGSSFASRLHADAIVTKTDDVCANRAGRRDDVDDGPPRRCVVGYFLEKLEREHESETRVVVFLARAAVGMTVATPIVLLVALNITEEETHRVFFAQGVVGGRMKSSDMDEEIFFIFFYFFGPRKNETLKLTLETP